MTTTAKAVGQSRKERASSVITPTPEKRQHHDLGMGTVAVAFAGLALAVMNYML